MRRSFSLLALISASTFGVLVACGGDDGTQPAPSDAGLADATTPSDAGADGGDARTSGDASHGEGDASDAGSDATHDDGDASDAGSADGGDATHDDGDAGDSGPGDAATVDPNWALWPMPSSPAQVAAGAPNPASYTDHHDGTVTDDVTGLTWQQLDTGDGGATIPVGSSGSSYCASLDLGGHQDWRVPTAIELVSIVNFDATGSGPMLNATYFPTTATSLQATVGLEGAVFWTATNSASPWTVSFYAGAHPGAVLQLASYTPSTRADYRCVRGGAGPFQIVTTPSNAPAGRYTAPASGVVYDTRTKLSWQRTPTATDGGTYPGFSFGDAKTYCAGLSLDGAGWRVPTVQELLTLVDRSLPPSLGSGPPVIDSAFFARTPNDFNNDFWSSTPLAGSTTSAWYVGFDHGEAADGAQSNALYVRCVR